MGKQSGVVRRASGSRRGRVPVFGAVIALVAMLLVPAPAAFAAPGDFAFGVVTVDANQNNVLDAIGVAGTQDQPLAGATVTLRAADAPADHPGWTTTTGATGATSAWATGSAISATSGRTSSQTRCAAAPTMRATA